MIETDRLSLRVLEPIDKEAFFSYRSLPEVAQYQSWKPHTIAEAEEFINNNVGRFPEPQNSWFQLAICLKGGSLIGDMGIHFQEDDAQVEIGYTLSPHYQGQGYAREAVKAVLDYLFFTLKKHRVTASVDPHNERSINLLNNLGFRKEAHFKKSFYSNGQWTDDCIYAMLAEEWEKIHRR